MQIVVCLSRDLTFFSNMTYLADGGGFTHASLGLERDAEYYYSFNFKGLKKEYRTSLKKRPRQMCRYILEVPEEAGQKLHEIIAEMVEQKEKYQYAKLGVSLRLLNLPNENPDEDKYYCSQFVSAVLKASGCIDIKTPPEECTPNDLLKELKESGQIIAVEEESELVNPGEAAIDKAIVQAEKGHDKVFQTIGRNLEQSLEEKNIGKTISTLAAGAGISKLNPLYQKMINMLGTAEDAVGDGPEKLAQHTSSWLKQGTGKLLEAKEKGPEKLRKAKEKGTEMLQQVKEKGSEIRLEAKEKRAEKLQTAKNKGRKNHK